MAFAFLGCSPKHHLEHTTTPVSWGPIMPVHVGAGDTHLAVADWVFLEPVDMEPELKSDVLELLTFKEPEKRWGRIVYGSQWLESEGLAVGDVVFFAKDADYEMDINGRKLWRMQIHHLLCVKQ